MARNKLKRKRTSLFKTLYVFFLVLLVAIFFKQEWSIYKVREASSDMTATVNSLQKTQSELKKEIGDLHDLSHIESVARSEYKMIKPNEIPIIIRE